MADDGVAIEDVRYDVTFNAETAASRSIGMEMTFTVSDPGPVILSLPTWTPGAYEIADFAKNVSSFTVTSGGSGVHWDKIDYDTWRLFTTAAGEVSVSFDILADTLDNARAWAQSDFAFFNGTTAFLFPETMGYGFPSRVAIHTEADWHVATGMTATGSREYSAESFHEVVDMPVFVGRFDLDSVEIGGMWYRLGTYPEGAMAGGSRRALWQQIEQMIPPQEAVFEEIPWEHYTTLLVFDTTLDGGGSALEHSNSHVGIYDPQFVGNPILALITAHEMFHAWNVKRLRPTELVPYDYTRTQPTTLLWVSEGITDYYADLALVRGNILPPQAFYQLTSFKVSSVADAPPVALEDASLTTWIAPTDGTHTIYYPKGSLAGMLLDMLIRDETDNRASLDDVMRDLYHGTYKKGEGFTLEQWWEAVERVAPGRSFEDFYARYIDGREVFPYAEVLPLGGMALFADTVRAPFFGVSHEVAEGGVVVTEVVPGGAAAAAGVEEGDFLVQVGEIQVAGLEWGDLYRNRYRTEPEGTPVVVRVRRDGLERMLQGYVRFRETVEYAVGEDGNASEKARRIREGILRGTVDR
jgi:predicted metalloprotease with PDZ domain